MNMGKVLPSSSPLKPPQQQPRGGNCYVCNCAGHWARDCPSRAGHQMKGQQPEEPASDFVFPDMLCPNGDDFCIVITAHTKENPDRKFYRCRSCGCSIKTSGTQKGFMWCDRMLSLAIDNIGPKKCQCGAGWCIRLKFEYGEKAGREYFVCPNKKAPCGYFLLCKEPSSIEFGYPETYPMCPCGAGRSRLYLDDSGRLHLGCTVLKGQGACNFIQWCDSVEGEHEMGSSGDGHEASSGNNQQEWDERISFSKSDGPCPSESGVEAITLDGEDAEILEVLYSKMAASSRTPIKTTTLDGHAAGMV